MGFSIGKIFGGAAGLVAGIPGAIAGAALGDKVLGGGNGGVDAFGLPIDPRLKEIADEERKTSEEYDKNAAGTARELTDINSSNVRRELAGQLRSNAENAGSRGLLNSGIRKSADAGARAGAATSAAQGARTANDTVGSTRDQLGYDASNAAMRMYGIQADTAASNYGMAMQRMSQNNQGLASLGKGVGALAGYMAAPGAPKAPAAKPTMGGTPSYDFSGVA